jgi:hypothetical protein
MQHGGCKVTVNSHQYRKYIPLHSVRSNSVLPFKIRRRSASRVPDIKQHSSISRGKFYKLKGYQTKPSITAPQLFKGKEPVYTALGFPSSQNLRYELT